MKYLLAGVMTCLAGGLAFGGIDNVPGDYDVLARDLAAEASARAATDAGKLDRDGGNMLPAAVIVGDTGYSYTPGIYTRISEASYQKSSNIKIQKYGGYWAMVSLFDDEVLERYRVDSDADLPPESGWYAVNGSGEPLPTLSYVAASTITEILGIALDGKLYDDGTNLFLRDS